MMKFQKIMMIMLIMFEIVSVLLCDDRNLPGFELEYTCVKSRLVVLMQICTTSMSAIMKFIKHG